MTYTQKELCVTWLTFGQFSWVILKLTQIWNRVRHIRLTALYMQQIESMYPHNIPAWVTRLNSIESNDSQKFNSVSLHGQINDSPKWVFWLKIYYVCSFKGISIQKPFSLGHYICHRRWNCWKLLLQKTRLDKHSVLFSSSLYLLFQVHNYMYANMYATYIGNKPNQGYVFETDYRM